MPEKLLKRTKKAETVGIPDFWFRGMDVDLTTIRIHCVIFVIGYVTHFGGKLRVTGHLDYLTHSRNQITVMVSCLGNFCAQYWRFHDSARIHLLYCHLRLDVQIGRVMRVVIALVVSFVQKCVYSDNEMLHV